MTVTDSVRVRQIEWQTVTVLRIVSVVLGLFDSVE